MTRFILSIAALLVVAVPAGAQSSAQGPSEGDCGYFQTCGVFLYSHEIQEGVFGDYTEPHGCTLAGHTHTSCGSASAVDLQRAKELDDLLLGVRGPERVAALSERFGENLVVDRNALLVYGLACSEGRVIARIPLSTGEAAIVQRRPEITVAGL